MKTRFLLLAFFLILLGCKGSKGLSDSEESSSSTSSAEEVESGSGSQMKITNAVECILTFPGSIVVVDDFNDPAADYDEMALIDSYIDVRQGADFSKYNGLLNGIKIEKEKAAEEVSEEVDDEDIYLVEEEIIEEEEIQVVQKIGYGTALARDVTTIILDTERDASGNALNRHIYFYDGKKNALASNGRHIQGDNKMSRVSLPATDDKIVDWRRELQNVIASKNEPLLREISRYKKEFNQGNISEAEFNAKVNEIKMRNIQDHEAPHAIFILKAMDNVDCGDVIDALTMMQKCYISTYRLDDVTSTDSVMVFNSLFPSEDMSPGVDFYSHGELGENQNLAVFPWCDLEKDFINPLWYDPLLTIDVTSSRREGIRADFTMTMNEGVLRKFYQDENYPKDNIDGLFSNDNYKKMVQLCGIDRNQPYKFELGPNDYMGIAMNDFRGSLSLTRMMLGLIRAGNLYRHNNIMVHVDRHTLFGALKIVLDNLRYENFHVSQRVTLAY